MKLLTVFTPTYNRAHTIGRTYESLCRQTCDDFEWLVIDDGSTDGTRELIQGFISEGRIPIRYIYKENGGLYTGYNTAYANAETELCVCIDSDDFMPDNAVELIVREWRTRGGEQYAGVLGLDYNLRTGEPIGGKFPEGLSEVYIMDLGLHNLHHGDSKQALRTDLMKQVAPQVGFPGEKDFNPFYMIAQVCDRLPLLVLNKNLCWVEYQEGDSMSAGIIEQYFRSPRSFAKMRIMEMQLTRNTLRNKMRSTIHYVAECMIARDSHWLRNSPQKLMTLLLSPAGALLYVLLRRKYKKGKL